MRALAVIVGLAIAAPGLARAEGELVLRPAGTAKVKERHRQRVETSLASAAAAHGARLAGADTLPADAAECATDRACLARLGSSEGAGRVIGALLEDLGGDRFRLTLVAIDVAAAHEAARLQVELVKEDLPRVPGQKLGALLDTLAAQPLAAAVVVAPAATVPAPVPADADAAAPVAGPDTAPDAAVAMPPPASVAVTASAPSAAVEASASSPRLTLCLALGAVVPRGGLDVGGRVALDAGYRIGRGLVVGAALDWTRVGHAGDARLGAPAYPPGMAEVIQTTDVVALSLGAGLRVTRWSWAELWAGAAAGVGWNRSQFAVYSTSREARAWAPLVGASLGLRKPDGGLGWRVELGWREAVHDLGAAGTAGEDVTSGLLLDVGVELGR